MRVRGIASVLGVPLFALGFAALGSTSIAPVHAQTFLRTAGVSGKTLTHEQRDSLFREFLQWQGAQRARHQR
jgi:hypothetical protein